MFLTESVGYNIAHVRINATPEALLEAVMDVQNDFYNLDMAMARCEYASIKNESVVLLNEGLKEYWNTFKEWIKKIWGQFKNWIAGIISWISTYFMGAEKFLKKYADILKQTTTLTGKTFMLYKNLTDPYKALESINNDLLTGSSMDPSSEEQTEKKISLSDVRDQFLKDALEDENASSLTEGLWNRIAGGNEKKEKKIDSGYITICIDILKDGDKFKTSLNKLSETVQKNFEKAVENANKAAEAASREVQNLNAKSTPANIHDTHKNNNLAAATANNCKIVALFASSLLSTEVSIVKTISSHALTILKGVISGRASLSHKGPIGESASLLTQYGL
jgi:hypothetical protein